MVEIYRKTYSFLCFILCLMIGIQSCGDSKKKTSDSKTEGYAGSASCISCHKKFYDLWSHSHHGKAMQPFTSEFARSELLFPDVEIEIDTYKYRPLLQGNKGWIIESGPEGEEKYEIVHALGGKNVYYFLTPLKKGRLQVLPKGYHVRNKQWFNTTGSMVRHFSDIEDEALHWREEPLTFNTSCHSCHVSQLVTNYDKDTDTYHTTWTESRESIAKHAMVHRKIM